MLCLSGLGVMSGYRRNTEGAQLGVCLACIGGLLLFLGWVLSLLRRGYALDDVDVDKLLGVGSSGQVGRNVTWPQRGKTTIYWPPLEPLTNTNEKEGPYPKYTSLLSLVSAWNPDNPDPPSEFHETLQHFNYSDPAERAMAAKYRDAELPFKLFGVPEFAEVSRLWTDEYLMENISEDPHAEASDSNHFMYWNLAGRTQEGYVPPTELVDMSFKKWLSLAHRADQVRISADTKHFYYMSGSPPRDRTGSVYSRDLKLFSTNENNFFITNVKANKGIQCRFGMRGIISEAHYDSGRNMVAMLRGEKRYMLSPPRTCNKLGIISDVRHPSFRHSIIDWSDSNQARSRGFHDVDAIDTIVRTGEVLYIPSYWFHYIISMKLSIQCNSRSGSPPNRQGEAEINECMGEKEKLKMIKKKAEKIAP